MDPGQGYVSFDYQGKLEVHGKQPYLANLINFGILPLVFVNSADYDKFEQGDQLEINVGEIEAQTQTFVTNTTKKIQIPVSNLLTPQELEIIKKGGRLNWIKERSR